MHCNPNEPIKHDMAAGFVQLLCTCAGATHRHLHTVHHQGSHILSWPIRRGQEGRQHLPGGFPHWTGNSSHLLTGRLLLPSAHTHTHTHTQTHTHTDTCARTHARTQFVYKISFGIDLLLPLVLPAWPKRGSAVLGETASTETVHISITHNKPSDHTHDNVNNDNSDDCNDESINRKHEARTQ